MASGRVSLRQRAGATTAAHGAGFVADSAVHPDASFAESHREWFRFIRATTSGPADVNARIHKQVQHMRAGTLNVSEVTWKTLEAISQTGKRG